MGRIVGAWFLREDWDEIKRICADDLQATYDEWLATAEQNVAAGLAQGFAVEKVIVRPHDIRKRERATGRKVDYSGRAEIAIQLLQAQESKTRH